MALAIDAASGNSPGAVTTFSWSHTCTGTDRLLLVFVSIRYAGLARSVSTLTYNAVDLTLVGTRQGPGNPDARVEVWRLVNPASGLNTVAVTLNGSARVCGAAVSFNGADQTTPVEGFVTSEGTTVGSPFTVDDDVTSKSGDIVIDALAVNEILTTESVSGAGQTQQDERTDGADFIYQGVSTEAGATTVTMSWDITNPGQAFVHAALNVRAKPPLPGLTHIKDMAGRFVAKGIQEG